jgi:putative DNA primase/helicase
MASSLDDVIDQMRQVGLDVPASVDLSAALKGYLRWRPSCEKKAKKSAWARLFEYTSPKGRVYITGAYGWRGDKWEVEATATDWTPAERAEWMEQRKAAAKAAEAERAKDAETAAEKARRLWNAGRDEGPSAYLDRKRVRAYGIRFGFNKRLMVPLRDIAGELHGLQWISPEGEKIFGTGTAKEGRFHLVGEVAPDKPLAFAEGYATAATGHMAMGWPVVVCFDAGNIEPVMAQWRKLYPDQPFVVLADDDRHLLQRLCERLARLGISATPAELGKLAEEHEWSVPGVGPDGADQVVELKAGWAKDACSVPFIQGSITVDGQPRLLKLENAGRARAMAAAKRHKARVLLPSFRDAESQHTDWNDLHVSAGLEEVREQLQRALDAPEGEKTRANGAPQGGRKGAGDAKGPQGDGSGYVNFLERYTLIYGTTTVWDAAHRDIVRIESLKLAYGKLVDWWLGHEDRRMVPKDNVVFDPTGRLQAPDYVNLFDRLPLEPDPSGSCVRIVEHLYNICQENDALFHWVASWLALPLQQPGTKMRTALVLHGRTEGTGKTTLTDIMRRIYGRYSRSITQLQLQTEFTGWMSGQCFCVAEEVVSRQDRSHHKGLLQNLITNETVQINEKNMPLREEKNHANFVFLSNDQIPMLLNPRDRRYTVIRVEREHSAEYFDAIRAELDAGGAEAFYAWLMNYDLKGFNAFTRPFENRDRMHLITLGMSPDQRFMEYWRTGLAGVPFVCCTARDLYRAFQAWCKVNGEKFVPNSTAFGRTATEELERLKAPPKAKMRVKCWSEKQIEDGDFSTDSSSQQALVYLVHREIERLSLIDKDEPPTGAQDGATGPPGASTPEVHDTRVISERVRLFQEKLHELVRSARRTV